MEQEQEQGEKLVELLIRGNLLMAELVSCLSSAVT